MEYNIKTNKGIYKEGAFTILSSSKDNGFSLSYHENNELMLVEDIKRIDENLAYGYGVLHGLDTQKVMSKKDFFKRLRRGIVKGKVLGIEIQGCTFKIDWFERIGDKVVDHHDTITLDSVDDKFRKQFGKCKKLLNDAFWGFARRAAKKRGSLGDSEDIFNKSVRLLEAHSNSNFKGFDMTLEEAQEVYDYILDNPYVANFPFKNSSDNRSWMFSLKITSVLCGMIGLASPFFIGFSVPGVVSFIMGLSIAACAQQCKESFSSIDRRKTMIEVRKELKESYPQITLDEMDCEKTLNYVDFIDRDIDYLLEHDEIIGDVDALSELSIEYSKARHAQFEYDSKLGVSVWEKRPKIDMKDYLMRLMNLEIAMYSENPRVGLSREDKHEEFENYFYSIMRMFGYNKDFIAHNHFLLGLLTLANTISGMAYEGLEVEVCELFKLGICYADALGEDGSVDDEYIKGLNAIGLEVVKAAEYKYNDAKKLEELADKIMEEERAKEPTSMISEKNAFTMKQVEKK